MSVNETEPVSLSVAVGTVIATGVALAALLWPQRLTPELQAGIVVFANAINLYRQNFHLPRYGAEITWRPGKASAAATA